MNVDEARSLRPGDRLVVRIDVAGVEIERGAEPERPRCAMGSAERMLWSGSQYIGSHGIGLDDASAAPAPEPQFSPLIAQPARRCDVEFLHEADFGSLVTHVLTLRAFLPPEYPAWAEVLDRLFIKLQIPFYEVAARDLESRAARAELAPGMHDELPLGDPHAIALLAEQALAEASVEPDSRALLADYRAALRRSLESFASVEEFIEALRAPAPAELDLARSRLVKSLAVPDR